MRAEPASQGPRVGSGVSGRVAALPAWGRRLTSRGFAARPRGVPVSRARGGAGSRLGITAWHGGRTREVRRDAEGSAAEGGGPQCGTDAGSNQGRGREGSGTEGGWEPRVSFLGRP
jgi:hypothetical protein